MASHNRAADADRGVAVFEGMSLRHPDDPAPEDRIQHDIPVPDPAPDPAAPANEPWKPVNPAMAHADKDMVPAFMADQDKAASKADQSK